MKYYFKRVFDIIIRMALGKKRFDEILRKREMKMNSELLKKNGAEAISAFSEVVADEGTKYWLFWGTLLGAYRDKNFIKLDEDVDVGMFYNDMTENLISNMISKGFTCLYVIIDKNIEGGLHFAFDYKGVKFDIYSFSENTDKQTYTVLLPLPYNYGNEIEEERTDIWEEVHVRVPKWQDLDNISFVGTSTYIPNNTDEILKILYGSNYMTPIVGYKANDEYTENKIHENPQNTYACMMSFEAYKMLKQYI